MVALRTRFTAIIAACLFAVGSGTAAAAPDGGPGTTDRTSERATDHTSEHTSASASAANRIDDGSFEYPTAPANSFTTVTAGQSIGPWQVTGGAVDLIGAGFWEAAEGGQSVDLNATRAGAVTQTFKTKPDQTYTVTYALAANPEGGPAVKTGRVLVDGQNFQDFSFDSTGKTRADMGYVKRHLVFVATADTTTLTFASGVPGAHGPVIDDVAVRGCHSCCGR
ncbi:choice-of-anchor C family protein [Streptomyces sp. TRM 70351]|uniref:choice-of-anchor C family protein n=1 Tax=Streptomyces sp. TRM 70351 TaxID=3116552 RepID=UPI002E7C484D|nr:choice-of-anchor C family protein [Streptomyces sp. TRM 70351]MEE1929370.1 choice-of-anchor C family protein [Streptomyces sp. TRM 70351]